MPSQGFLSDGKVVSSDICRVHAKPGFLFCVDVSYYVLAGML